MDKEFDVSVIMINYKTFDLAKAAIESMFLHTLKLNLQVIVVDNMSPDGSGEKIKNHFGDKILFLQAEENLGTSRAFNFGLKHATGKYVLWLNPDVLFTEDFIGKLYRFMEENPDCGVCGGNLIGKNGKPCHSFRKNMISLKTVKKDYSLVRRALRKVFKRFLSEEYNYSKKVREVGYITGADMFVRRDIFDVLGGFDEDIFMYAEETEFQFRVKKFTDYKICSVPDARLIHLEGQSFNGSDFYKTRQRRIVNGMYIFMGKCYGKNEAIRYIDTTVCACKKILWFVWPFSDKRKMVCARLKAAKAVKEELIKGNL